MMSSDNNFRRSSSNSSGSHMDLDLGSKTKGQTFRKRNNSQIVSDDLLESLWSSFSSSSSVTMDERIGIMERAVVESLRSAMTRFTRAEQSVYIEAAVCGKRWLEKYFKRRQGDSDESEKIEMFTPGDDDGRKRFLQSVGACLRQLRLLNALRDVHIGIPLTPPQLTYMGEHVLIARLTRRRMSALNANEPEHKRRYELATRLTKHLQRHHDRDAIMLMWESDLLDAEKSRERRRQQDRVEAMIARSENETPPRKPSRRRSSSASSKKITLSPEKHDEQGDKKEQEEDGEETLKRNRERVLLSRLQNNFFKHSFSSYGSAAVVAGLRHQTSLSRRLLRHETSQRIRVASLLLLDSPSYREKALREAASEPFGYLDRELLVATLLRVQSVVYPVKKISDDDFTDEARRIGAQQESEMHRMILAKNMPRSVLSCYVGLLRKMGLGNRLQRLLVKADMIIDAAHMYVERGCRFYLGKSSQDSYESSTVVDVIGDKNEETTLLGRRLKHDPRDTYEITTWRPSRSQRRSTTKASRLATEKRYIFLATGQKLCAKYRGDPESVKSKLSAEYAIALQQEIELLRLQVKWAPRTIGGSVVDTMLRLIGRKGEGSDGAMKLVEQMRDVFHIPVNRFERILVRGLARAAKWSELAEFVEKRGESISGGLAGVVDACMEAENGMVEAVQYAHKIKDRRQKLEKMVELEEWDTAALLAVQLGDSGVSFLLRSHNLPEDIRSQLQGEEEDEVAAPEIMFASVRGARSLSMRDSLDSVSSPSNKRRSAVFSAPFRSDRRSRSAFESSVRDSTARASGIFSSIFRKSTAMSHSSS